MASAAACMCASSYHMRAQKCACTDIGTHARMYGCCYCARYACPAEAIWRLGIVVGMGLKGLWGGFGRFWGGSGEALGFGMGAFWEASWEPWGGSGRLRADLWVLSVPQVAPGGPKKAPRSSQEWPQRRPRGAQEASKSAPKGPQDGPRGD